jgi:hypothetical protein
MGAAKAGKFIHGDLFDRYDWGRGLSNPPLRAWSPGKRSFLRRRREDRAAIFLI